MTRYYVRIPSGALHGFCSDEHRQRFLIADAAHQAPGTRSLDVDTRPTHSCSTCSWCGLVVPSRACLFHEVCPVFQWEGTAAARYVIQFLQRTNGPQLGPATLARLGEACAAQHEAGEFPCVAALLADMAATAAGG